MSDSTIRSQTACTNRMRSSTGQESTSRRTAAMSIDLYPSDLRYPALTNGLPAASSVLIQAASSPSLASACNRICSRGGERPGGSWALIEQVIHRDSPAGHGWFRISNLTPTIDRRVFRIGGPVGLDHIRAQQIQIPDHERPGREVVRAFVGNGLF